MKDVVSNNSREFLPAMILESGIRNGDQGLAADWCDLDFLTLNIFIGVIPSAAVFQAERGSRVAASPDAAALHAAVQKFSARFDAFPGHTLR
jgi:hypothetical protein